MERKDPDGTKTAVNREAEELLRQAYSETEAWKVAQLAATLAAGLLAADCEVRATGVVFDARAILAEARRPFRAQINHGGA